MPSSPSEPRYTDVLGREVFLRSDTSDSQVWGDAFIYGYHVPPAGIEPRTVLDLGANIGLASAHYCVLWPEAVVVGIEMDRENAIMARRNAPAAEIYNHAVGAKPGRGFFHPHTEQQSYRLVYEPTADTKPCLVLTLAETIRRSFGSEVDFVKMDIEGTEWELLDEPQEWAPLVKSILIELHPWGERNLLKLGMPLLEKAGFATQIHIPHPHAIYGVRS